MAEAFCYGSTGFSREGIPEYFVKYQGDVPTIHSQLGADKTGVFISCVAALTPGNQRLALYDLCDDPPPLAHPMPSASIRAELLATLVQAHGRAPLGVELSSMTMRGIREQWSTAASRIPSSPPAAITAARSLLEATCKTILAEHGRKDLSGGDLSGLYKHVREVLGIEPKKGASQNVHQITSGLSHDIDGLANLSNKAGDRYGLVAGEKIHDISFASLAVHAARTVSLFLVRVHRDLTSGPLAE